MTAPAYYCKKFNKSISDPRANFSLVDKEDYFFWPAETLGRDAGGGGASSWWCWGDGGEEFQQKPSRSGLTYQMFTDVPEVCKWASWEIKQVGVCQARKSVMAKRSVAVLPVGEGGHLQAPSRWLLPNPPSPLPQSIHSVHPAPLPGIQPWSKRPLSETGGWVSKAAESLRPTQRRPVSIIKSAPFPECTCIWHQRKKKSCSDGGGGAQMPSLSYCRSLPEVDLCSSQTLNLSAPCHSSACYEV